jgi:hypothetical protein
MPSDAEQATGCSAKAAHVQQLQWTNPPRSAPLLFNQQDAGGVCTVVVVSGVPLAAPGGACMGVYQMEHASTRKIDSEFKKNLQRPTFKKMILPKAGTCLPGGLGIGSSVEVAYLYYFSGRWALGDKHGGNAFSVHSSAGAPYKASKEWKQEFYSKQRDDSNEDASSITYNYAPRFQVECWKEPTSLPTPAPVTTSPTPAPSPAPTVSPTPGPTPLMHVCSQKNTPSRCGRHYDLQVNIFQASNFEAHGLRAAFCNATSTTFGLDSHNTIRIQSWNLAILSNHTKAAIVVYATVVAKKAMCSNNEEPVMCTQLVYFERLLHDIDTSGFRETFNQNLQQHGIQSGYVTLSLATAHSEESSALMPRKHGFGKVRVHLKSIRSPRSCTDMFFFYSTLP